jgi:anti-sigma factor RsiW
VPLGTADRGPAPPACAEVRAQLSTYADGVLPPESASRIEAHLAVCAACHREYKALKAEAALLSEALRGLRPSDSYRGRVAQDH